MTKRSTSGTRKTSSARGTTTRKTSSRAKAAAKPVILTRPEHRREMFALLLLTVAAITLIFFATGSSGWVGSRWVGITENLLGWGALVVPLALGVLGLAILWQERREDQQLTEATMLGTILTLLALQVLLEFALGSRASLEENVGEGGGIIGFYGRSLTARAIGDPATFVLYCVLGLAGVMLTFNITIRELVTGTRDSFARFMAAVWPVGKQPQARVVQRPAPVPAGSREHPYVPPPLNPDEALVPTPIAERPTKAGLFDRPENRVPEEAAKKPKAKAAETPQRASQRSTATQRCRNLLAAPAASLAATKADTAPKETVQQPLDGFEIDSVQHAWPMPTNEMLEIYTGNTTSPEEIKTKSRLIEETLASFKVEAQVKNVNIGPAVMQFELQPAVGVKVSKITSLERDLALSLAAQSLRIEAPIPGKNYVGIEIPNSTTSIVGLRELIEAEEFDASKTRAKAAARPRCLRASGGGRHGAHAAPAGGRLHRVGQVRRDERLCLRAAAQAHAGQPALHHGGPEDGGAGGLQPGAAPALAGGDRDGAGGADAQVDRVRDGAALQNLCQARLPQH